MHSSEREERSTVSQSDAILISTAGSRRRRRPSGEPPPLPRHVRRSGAWWLFGTSVATLLAILAFWGEWDGQAVDVTVADDALVRLVSAPSSPAYRQMWRVLAAPGDLVFLTVVLWSVVVALIVLRRLR